jgi:hypothetical protein
VIVTEKPPKEDNLHPEQCPIREFPCPRGTDTAIECQLRYQGDFNPMLNFHDFELLQCAAARAKELKLI